MEEILKEFEQTTFENNNIKRILSEPIQKTFAKRVYKIAGSEEKAREQFNYMLHATEQLNKDEVISIINFKKLLVKKVNYTGKSQKSNEKNVA